MQVPVEGEIQEPEAQSSVDFFRDIRKRFQEDHARLAPSLVLGADGMIKHVTPAARRLLEYRHAQHIDPSFFAHVHAKNLYKVMRDVADMVCYGKNSASWLIRLRTGRGHWRWFKATVKSRVHIEENSIHIDLHDLSDM